MFRKVLFFFTHKFTQGVFIASGGKNLAIFRPGVQRSTCTSRMLIKWELHSLAIVREHIRDGNLLSVTQKPANCCPEIVHRATERVTTTPSIRYHQKIFNVDKQTKMIDHPFKRLPSTTMSQPAGQKSGVKGRTDMVDWLEGWLLFKFCLWGLAREQTYVQIILKKDANSLNLN